MDLDHGAHVELDGAALGCREAAHTHSHHIGSIRYVRRHKIAALVGGHTLLKAGTDVRHRDRCTWNLRTRGVSHAPSDRACIKLGEHRQRAEYNDRQQCDRIKSGSEPRHS